MSRTQSGLEHILQSLSEVPYVSRPIQSPHSDTVASHADKTRWQGRGAQLLLCHSNSESDDNDGEPFECRIRGTVLKDSLNWNGSASAGRLVLGRSAGVRGRTFNQTISTLQVLPTDVKGFGHIKSCVKYEETHKAMLSVTVMGDALRANLIDTNGNPVVPIGESYTLKSREVDVMFLFDRSSCVVEGSLDRTGRCERSCNGRYDVREISEIPQIRRAYPIMKRQRKYEMRNVHYDDTRKQGNSAPSTGMTDDEEQSRKCDNGDYEDRPKMASGN
ncbi:hypothetical protein BDN72DRAFT_866285 [Pluteus cervinus]|uniref:Uncharacterized protein n=1 Tax=Pluteus cervinus TaxID=181527 RepID=A0ACD2ZX67_9AGAR|nr:hypothetical protein BDN72DRAFT_866285 [Pluteus cervinus]